MPSALDLDQLEHTSLFHWSPRARRARIEHSGLVPGSRALNGLWKPPFVSFGLDPLSAWTQVAPYNPTVTDWDLWLTGAHELHGFEVLPIANSDGHGKVWEVRVYHRVYKRDLWLVGSRST